MTSAADRLSDVAAAAKAANSADGLAWIVKAAEDRFGMPIQKMTAPGGRGRASFRIHFADRTVIASHRPSAQKRGREAEFLRAMNSQGAPVPEYMGQTQTGLLFQSDAGNIRLTSELLRREGTAREDLVAASFESLWRIKQAAQKTGFLPNAPVIATNADWLGRFATAPRRLSEALDILPPSVDYNAIAQSLVALPAAFVKWDARPGNAAVSPDGTTIWFDWEHYGRRGGSEDFGFLIADEFWPVEPGTSLRIFAETCPAHLDRHLPLLRRFATVQTCARLLLMHRQKQKHGWGEEARSRRYDQVGRAPELVRRLCRHGAEFANTDPLTRRLAPWFEQAGDIDLWG